ncbi:MAG: PKD domain-containing protein [Deltaproteobacteria bacterium]|nr:PKD domain-containing protein [Deltaproteobacteria bacterium]
MKSFRTICQEIGNRTAVVILLPVLIGVALAGAIPALAAEEIVSTYRRVGPRIDGSLGLFEWRGLHTAAFENGFVAVCNDATRLYLLVDVLEDDVEDPRTESSSGDCISIAVDTDRDGIRTPFTDVHYHFQSGSYSLERNEYGMAGTLVPPEITYLRSSVAAGFGCFSGDNTEILYRYPLAPVCNEHRIFEIAIDLEEIGDQVYDISPDDPVRLGLRVVSLNPDVDEYFPSGWSSDFEDMLEVILAVPDDLEPADPDASLRFEELPWAVEVTQAVQDRINSLRLVEHKDTVARVYVQARRTDTPQPVNVYLYGKREGVQLPGSPISMNFMAPADIDRDRLHGTANFLLPEFWTEGVVEFRARLLDAFGYDASSDAFTVLFEPKKVPVYWIVPINSGTEAAPDLPHETTIAESESYLKTIFPIYDVRFVRRSWRDIGALDRVVEGAYVHDVLDMLDDLWAAAFVAWMYSEMTDPYNTFECPEQIYGFLADGVSGQSRPVRSGGSGAAAVGTGGSNRDTTMAHEFDHNLDRSVPGSWGRHVCNPDLAYDRDWGCNADGCDPVWPWTNDGIQETGFDTRLPWIDGLENISDHGQPFTVMPAGSNEYPDLMSYCSAGFYVPEDMTSYYAKPTRWISIYRWETLFDFFPAAEDDDSAGSPGSIRPMCYFSGTVFKNGKGMLDPVFVQPGLETKGLRPGAYRVEALGTGGQVLFSVPFHAEFETEDGLQLDKASFRFQVPRKDGIAKIVLKKKQTVLDVISVSKHAPKVDILSPAGGEVLKEAGTVFWKAHDEDGDALRYVILYSPNKGKSWHPVKWGLEKEMYRVYSSDLPGGDEALFRVLATDGFNTVYADTKGTFAVPGKGPSAFITRPQTGSRFESGELVSFEGYAQDLEDPEIPGTSCLWSLGGKVLGRGKKLTAQLPDGVHEIQLTVSDSDENAVTETVTIAVGTDNLPKQLASIVQYKHE